MSAKNESIVRSMVDAIRNADKAKTSPYDTTATVRRVESGIAWVHIPGGVDETPVKLTIAAKPGDTVQVRVSGGRAFLVGNASAPPTDDRTANRATNYAQQAQQTATAAQNVAQTASNNASAAVRRAQQAYEAAKASVASDTMHYLATDLGTGVTIDTPGWTTTTQTITALLPYLWIYHTYTKANGSTVNSQPVIIGTYGKDGTSVTILGSYATLADLEAAHPTGSIGDAYMVAGDLYVWNGSAWEDVGQIQGPQGPQGATGETISSVTPQYYMSTSAQTPTGGSWSDTMDYVAGCYIWTRELILMTDNTVRISNPVYNSVLTSAWVNAASALQIAQDTNQYFWHTETGTDTGAHITEIPQEDFLRDPEHGGGNLLARSNGIAVRDGLTELSQFSANGLDVYGSNYNTSTQEYEQVEIAHLGYGEGSGSSGTAKAPYFTFGIRVGNKGNYSVAEGLNTRASGYCSHAEGNDAQATGNLSHAECRAIASGFESHSEGDESAATGIASHAEGYFTHAYGNYSHAQNYHTRANGDSQTVIGKYNAEDTTSAFIIGNGTGESNRHNALKVDWDGNLECNNIGAIVSASASKTIDTAGIDTYTEGPSVTLDAGVWVVTGQWVFNTGSTVAARNMGVQLSPNSGSTASGAYKMVRVKAADNSFASLEVTDIIILTASTTVYLKGASSMTYTTAARAAIKAVRIK